MGGYPLLEGVNVYLVGMMGSGKSTVGQCLAQELGYRFFDTDRVIEQVAGCTVAEIFAQSGEAQFRELETQVLAQLSPYTQLAIATGGGIVLRPKNWSYLHHGIVVWLNVPLDVLCTRLEADEQREPGIRPLLETKNLRKRLEDLLEQRHTYYRQADVNVEVYLSDTPQEIVERIFTEIRKIKRTDRGKFPPEIPTLNDN